MIAPLFYISSFGGSASAWLSKVLSMHPDIVCFHGTRSVPPRPSNENDMDPNVFMDSLNICSTGCFNQKIFGAAHGYYGIMAKEAVLDRGGVFAGIVRHPIRRIHSIFTHVVDNTEGLEYKKEDIYRLHFPGETEDLENRFDKDGHIRLSPAEVSFKSVCQATLLYDRQCIDGIDNDKLFLMENFVSDRQYFKKLVETLTSNKLEVTDKYLDRVFSLGVENRHSNMKLTPEQIYDQWPNVFKFAYLYHMLQCGGMDLQNRYIKLGYKMPPYCNVVLPLGSKVFVVNKAALIDAELVNY